MFCTFTTQINLSNHKTTSEHATQPDILALFHETFDEKKATKIEHNLNMSLIKATQFL